MAAFTRSGGGKASEIVMLTFRTLHRSRLAMLSAFAVRVGKKFIKPAAAPRNRCHQERAGLGAYRTSVLWWKKNLAAPR